MKAMASARILWSGAFPLELGWKKYIYIHPNNFFFFKFIYKNNVTYYIFIFLSYFSYAGEVDLFLNLFFN
jgi:hypothetical protein